MAKKPTYEELEQRVKKLENGTFGRKQAKKQSQLEHSRLMGILELIPDGVYIVDQHFNIEYINPVIERDFGKIQGRKCYQYLHNRTASCPWCKNEEVFAGRSVSWEWYSIKNDRHYDLFDTPFENPDGTISKLEIFHDITERKRAEEALREARDYLENLFNYTNAPIVVWNPGPRIVRFNHAFEHLTGYKDEEVIGKKLSMLFPEASTDESLKKIQHTLRGEYWESVEIPILCKNGDIRVVLWNSANIYAEDGTTLLSTIAQGIDISLKKKAAEALRGSEEKYRLLVENATEAIFIAQDQILKFVNPKTEEIIEYSAEELAKIPFVDIIHPEDRPMVLERHLKRLKGERLPSIYPFRILNKSGEELSVELNTVQINWEGRPATLNFLRDITAQKRLETQLQQAQKMEAIATLAGGVAHEFNNALMGIMGNLELLKMDLPDNERQDRYFEAMKGSGHRMSRLTDQLLAYAQGGKYQPKNMKLDDFVIETVPILQHDLGPEVRLETHFSKDISHIRADNAQIQMVLSAILANSNEAIENEGLIRIAAENKDIDEDFAKQHPGLKPGSYVCLTIEDNGKGMDEETRAGIFEPFFTTKFQGRGMGMAATHGIIMNHDGWIYVDSELGKGTIIHIYLPAISVGIKTQEAKDVKEPRDVLAMGEGTILVIEDEEDLVEMFRRILERLGYRVLEAKTGGEGVDIVKTFDGQIDLALLDIKLPDMSGTRVYPLIMEARPDLKVVVCSGYSIDGPARKILDAGAEGFIQKPFLIATLAEKLKEVLEGK